MTAADQAAARRDALVRRTLYIHIGNHRTGTTSIQRFLYGNAGKLLENGYLYPLGVRRHDKLVRGLFSKRTRVGEVIAHGHKIKGISSELNAEADEAGHRISSIVLSDEDICMSKDFRLLRQFREHFDVRIVFSLRRQDTWLESWYLQNIKWQWNADLSHCTFDDFLARVEDFHWLHYDTFVADLQEQFGAENVLINVFEKDQMPDGPVVDFCRLIGLNDLTGFSKPPHVNHSMSAEMTEFTRHLPLELLSNAEKYFLVDTLKRVDLKVLGNTGKQSERLMAPELRQRIIEKYSDGNRALARRYFERDALFPEPLPDQNTPLADLRIPEGSAEIIERIVSPLVLELSRRAKARTSQAQADDRGRQRLFSGRRAGNLVKSLKQRLF